MISTSTPAVPSKILNFCKPLRTAGRKMQEICSIIYFCTSVQLEICGGKSKLIYNYITCRAAYPAWPAPPSLSCSESLELLYQGSEAGGPPGLALRPDSTLQLLVILLWGVVHLPLVKIILTLVGPPSSGHRCKDRANWKLGSCEVNLKYVSISFSKLIW